MSGDGELLVLVFHRHNLAWAEAVLDSPPAQRARDDGVELQPRWANGAKILVAGMTAAVFESRDVQLQRFHVVIRAADREDLQNFLFEKLPFRARPRVRGSIVLGLHEDLRTWTFQIRHTFVNVPGSTVSSGPLDNVTASTMGGNAGYRNVRTLGPSSRRTRTIEEHAGEMKLYQSRNDLPQVLQCLSNIYADGLIPDAYCFTIIIDTCAKQKDAENAELYMRKMIEAGVTPNAVSYNCVMLACSNAKCPTKAEQWFQEAEQASVPMTPNQRAVAHNLLISAYTERLVEDTEKCGGSAPDFDKAKFWFDKLCSVHAPTIQSFSAFINTYAQLGRPDDAEDWLKQKLSAGLLRDRRDCAC